METAGKAREWRANAVKITERMRYGAWAIGGWDTMTWSSALSSAPFATFAAASRR